MFKKTYWLFIFYKVNTKHFYYINNKPSNLLEQLNLTWLKPLALISL